MSAIQFRLRVDQDGDVYHVVHEDSGKALCSGPWENVRHWLDAEPKRPTASLSDYLARKAKG